MAVAVRSLHRWRVSGYPFAAGIAVQLGARSAGFAIGQLERSLTQVNLSEYQKGYQE